MDLDSSPLRCPVDRAELASVPAGLRCTGCGRDYQLVDGIPDLAYSPLPDVDGHTAYIWSDVFYLENLLAQFVEPGATVVEVCSGGNIVVPLLLSRLGIQVSYWSVGTDLGHLRQQREGVAFDIHTVRGDATALPFASSTVDLYIGHHAINDVWLSKGDAGVEASYVEMDRLLRPDGYLIQSDVHLQHDARVGDPSTKIVDLRGLIAFLSARGYRWVRQNGGELDWVVASRERSCDIRPPSGYVLPPSPPVGQY